MSSRAYRATVPGPASRHRERRHDEEFQNVGDGELCCAFVPVLAAAAESMCVSINVCRGTSSFDALTSSPSTFEYSAHPSKTCHLLRMQARVDPGGGP